MRKLMGKEPIFVNEYLKSRNATQAAIKAGYSAKTARAMAYKLMQKEPIKNAIEKRQNKAIKKADISLDWWLGRTKEMAMTAKSDSDRLKALDMLGKQLGVYVNRLEIIDRMSPVQIDELTVNLLQQVNLMDDGASDD